PEAQNELEEQMKRHRRTTAAAALLGVAAALIFGTRLLTAGAEAPPVAPAASAGSSGALQSAPAAVTPLPDFKPSEELSADAAVAFPTDI
ncbi:MAG: hypothetical protein QNL88_04870, partial [Acidobacteriota bacterium]|nr:hypothetical protein [Acidobacteriota bacterium]